MSLSISERAVKCQASPIRRLVPLANQAKARGIHVYHLNIGQPDVETPKQFWDAIKNYESKVLAYGESGGLPEFRRGLVGYYAKYGVNVTADEILITTGGSEALLFTMLTTCNPGDEVIVFEPFYTNYNSFATMAGVKVVPVPGKAENGFRLPAREEIEKRINNRTRAILYCSPGNPTGVVYTRDELQVLADIALKHDLFLVADEVYREFVYDGSVFTSLMTIPGLEQHAIIADSISKRFSACGARVGNIVTKNKDVLAAALKFGQARLCPPTLEQVGALGVLNIDESYYHGVQAEYQRRRDTIVKGLNDIPGVSTYVPKGAFYTVAKLPIDNADRFASWLLTEYSEDGATVMVAPANGFYATPGMGEDEVRIAYVLNVNDLEKAMVVLKHAIAAYRSKVMGL